MKKLYKVTTETEIRTSNGSVPDLKNFKDETARKACYIYERSNSSQQAFLNEVLRPHIVIKTKVRVNDCIVWDRTEETVLSRKVESFNPPYDIRDKVNRLYNQTVQKNLPTNEQAKTSEKQCKIDDGFERFFDK